MTTSRGHSLPAHMRELVDRELAKELDCLHRDVKPANVLAKAHGPAAKREDGYASKTEADYAAWLHGIAGIVWRYERHTIGLPGKATRYRADFSIRVHDQAVDVTTARAPRWLPSMGRPCLVEVKGATGEGRPYWRSEASRLRALTGAAEWWDSLRIPLFVAWRVRGVWMHEPIEVRS